MQTCKRPLETGEQRCNRKRPLPLLSGIWDIAQCATKNCAAKHKKKTKAPLAREVGRPVLVLLVLCMALCCPPHAS